MCGVNDRAHTTILDNMIEDPRISHSIKMDAIDQLTMIFMQQDCQRVRMISVQVCNHLRSCISVYHLSITVCGLCCANLAELSPTTWPLQSMCTPNQEILKHRNLIYRSLISRLGSLLPPIVCVSD